METIEVSFLGKKFCFQTDTPEDFKDLCSNINWDLSQLNEDYPSYSREQIMLLYILRNWQKEFDNDDHSPEKKNEASAPFLSENQKEISSNDDDDTADEQLDVNLDEINDILNTEF